MPGIRHISKTFLSTLSLRRATVMHALILADAMLFLSTLSLRRATILPGRLGFLIFHFYPRSPCGERLRRHRRDDRRPIYFYPRSPCGERPCITTTTICIASFLSTLSLRRATTKHDQGASNQTISIHALLAESDASLT